MQAEGAALAVGNGKGFALAATHGATPAAEVVPGMVAAHTTALARGEAVDLAVHETAQELAHLQVSLLGQRAERPELIGVLLCGPRKSGRTRWR